MNKKDKTYLYRKNIWGSFFLLMVILACCRVVARAEDTCTVERPEDAREAVRLVLEDWEQDYYGEILVREDSNRIEIDGEKDSFTDTFSVSAGEMRNAVSSEDNLSRFLDKKTEEDGKIYEVDRKEEGVYSLTSPYQSKRIVVYSTNLPDSYGAENKYIYEEGNETILCFDTEEDTKEAFEQIQKDYGQKNCFVDEIYSVEDMAASSSWGGDTTGMASLKTGEFVAALSSKVTVAVIDTGINKKHNMFKGRKILSDSYNFMDNNSNINDYNGHGTHVAGIITDLTPDNVQLLVLKIADPDGSSSSLIMNLAVNYAISKKADVMNISYGFLFKDAGCLTFLDKAIDRAYKKGIPVVTAAGNLVDDVAGRNVKNCYPACNNQTIAVSALDKNLKLAKYSYYGTAIDFTAPGSQVSSAWIGSDSKMKEESGTSMAAPHITAALAYIKLRDKTLSVQGAYLELKSFCKDLGEKGKDEKYGYGYPDLTNFFTSQVNYAGWTVSNMLKSPRITLCSNGGKGMRLKWTPVAGAQGYEVYRRKNVGILHKIATLSSLSYVDRNLKEGDYCVYYVVAYTKQSGIRSISGNSNTVTNIFLKKNRILQASKTGSRYIFLKWKKLPWFQGKYIQIQYSRRKDFKKKKTKTIYTYRNSYRFRPNMKGLLYIRIRSKVLCDDKKSYYSVWSRIKKVKIK